MLNGAGAWTTDRRQLDATRRALGLAPTESDVGAWESTDLLLVTAPRWFDAPSSTFPRNVVHAGPLGVNLPTSEPQRRQRPFVLLAFSTTVIEGQEHLVQRTCDAIASLPVDALLTLGPSIEASELRLPTNVTAVAHVDHDRVLPETSAVVTHGGLGTTLRALAHGIPLVLAPLARDQHFNARRVCAFGAGLQLDADAATSELRSGVESVLRDGRFAEAAKRAAQRVVSDQPDRVATEAMRRLAATRRAEGA
jgi:MGT family glycosyltransferase